MSIRNLKSQKRKKYKRAVNRFVRAFNQNVKNDWLWNGRFVISQNWATFEPYADRSGSSYYVGLIITDKKTGYKEYTYMNNYELEWHMWEWANWCITEKWNVWKEEPNPNEQARLEGREPPKWPN